MTTRPAELSDLEFLVRVDLEDEGVDPGYRAGWGAKELHERQAMVRSFITDDDKGAWILESGETELLGGVMWRYRNIKSEILPADSVFLKLEPTLFPPDGRFCEIFQLWVDPRFRRQGHGTCLKRIAEDESRNRGIGMIYTHTEDRNLHVLNLNLKLGYTEARRGTIWDEVIRISLVKQLA